MTTEAQKRSEREVVELIFPATQYQTTSCETPDFRVRVGSGEFGVEVTQLYESGSNARLVNRPSYVPDLLAGVAPIHKDDAHLALREVVVERGHDGSRETTQVVLSPIPSVAAYEHLLVDVVQSKSNKAYADDLLFLDLVVEDKTMSLALVEHKRVVELLIRDELIRALATCCFREVFLLTRCKEHRAIVVPLKASLLMREILVFMHACKAIEAEKGALPSAHGHEVLAEYCRRRGFSVRLYETDNRQLLVYGSMSVILSEAKTFGFGVHHDHVLPTVEVVMSEDARSRYEPVFQEADVWAKKYTAPVEPAVLVASDQPYQDGRLHDEHAGL